MIPGEGAGSAASKRLDVWAGGGFAHEALIFGDDRQLVERCIPFVHEAFASRQPVLVMASDRTRGLLSEQLGSEAARLQVLGRAESAWLGGHETLLAYDRNFRHVAEGGTPWRLIAEPVWLERADGQEWHRFESACNRLLEDVPYYSLCLHDRRRLSEDVLKTVRKTHPLVCDQHGLRASEDFVEPETLVPGLEPPWSPLPKDAEHAEVASPREGRLVATAAAEQAGLDDRRTDIVLAVDELVANSLELCGGAAIDYWCDAGDLSLQVSDCGAGEIGVLSGYGPPSGATDSGRSLWLARALADDATLRSGPAGSAVRLLFALPVDN